MKEKECLAIYMACCCVITCYFIQIHGYVVERQTQYYPNTSNITKEDVNKLREIYHKHMHRLNHVERTCDKVGKSRDIWSGSHSWMRYLFVDKEHKILYCMVPKVACSNWLKVLLELDGRASEEDMKDRRKIHGILRPKYLTTLRSYYRRPKELEEIVNTYYSFMFVRDPFVRMLSAYRDKFRTREAYYSRKMAEEIIANYRSNSEDSQKRFNEKDFSTDYQYMVSFEEFIEYVIDKGTLDEFNEHWEPYHELCRPCAVHYNAIGKYEDLQEDANFILQEAGVKDLVYFPISETLNHSSTTDLIGEAYSMISVDQRNKVENLYAKDYDLFEYDTADTEK